jgi:selenocysteine lyase/cysteine desulfurase
MPSMMEAGNLNVPALAGWLEALRELTSSELEHRIQHARELSERLHQGLDSLDHIRVFGCAGELPIASITVDSISPTDAAAILDAEFGVETRAGMHCAALVHQFLGSSAEGTLRISAGHTSTDSDVDAVIESLRSIVTTLHSA